MLGFPKYGWTNICQKILIKDIIELAIKKIFYKIIDKSIKMC